MSTQTIGLLPVLATAVLAFLLCRGVVAGLLKWAAVRLLDIPNERSSHEAATPRGGGLGVACAGLLGWAAWSWADGGPVHWGWVAGIATSIAALGLIDDLLSLAAKTRFTAQLCCAILTVWLLGPFQDMALPGGLRITFGAASALVTVVWIVGLTNAFNFMDGIDGIASGQALAAALGYGAVAWGLGEAWAVGLCAALAGSSFAFLLLNWHPARIFMGDVGSTFLGYVFSVLPLAIGQAGGRPDSPMPLVAVLMVWPFVFDASFTFLARLSRGENVLTAHRSHLYQRLVISGLSHRSVSGIYCALAAGCAGSAGALEGSWTPAFAMMIVVPIALVVAVVTRERLRTPLGHEEDAVS